MAFLNARFLNSVRFLRNPWQYSKGSFYKPLKPTVPLFAKKMISNQTLYRLYLLFPTFTKQEIIRMYRESKGDRFKSLDILLCAQMFRARNLCRYKRPIHTTKCDGRKLPSQCARSSILQKNIGKQINRRTITSGIVYNLKPDTTSVPQVQQILENFNTNLWFKRFRYIAPNITFDSRGIKHIVFENIGFAAKNQRNKPSARASSNTEKRSTLDNLGEKKLVLRNQLPDSNSTNSPRDRIIMKIVRFGGKYRSEIISD